MPRHSRTRAPSPGRAPGPAEDDDRLAGEVDCAARAQRLGRNQRAEGRSDRNAERSLQPHPHTSTSAAARGRARVPGSVTQVEACFRCARNHRFHGGLRGLTRMQSPDPPAASWALGLCAKGSQRIGPRRMPRRHDRRNGRNGEHHTGHGGVGHDVERRDAEEQGAQAAGQHRGNGQAKPTPSAARVSPCRRTMPASSRRVAPSASRTPNSRRRRRFSDAITPNSPVAASPSARPAKSVVNCALTRFVSRLRSTTAVIGRRWAIDWSASTSRIAWRTAPASAAGSAAARTTIAMRSCVRCASGQ